MADFEIEKLEKSLNRNISIDNKIDDNDKFSMTISTEEPIKRYDWYSEKSYDEVLLHGNDNIDLSRSKNIKLFWSHNRNDLPIGRLENVRIEDKKLKADAILSKNHPDYKIIRGMVEDGTLSEISVGGNVLERRVTQRENDIALVEIVRWELLEASIVGIGADKNAGINRNYEERKNMAKEIEELKRELNEVKQNGGDTDAVARLEAQINDEIERVKAENEELKRVADIKDLASENQADSELVARFIYDKSKTANDLARELLKVKKEAQTNVSFEVSRNQNDLNREAIVDALIIRAGGTLAKPNERANEYATASLIDIAREITGYTGNSRDELARNALTSDSFPLLMQDVSSRMMADAFERAETTYQVWTTPTELRDFREAKEVSLVGMSGRLDKLVEGGEVKAKEFNEHGTTWRLFTFANKFKVTYQMLINDDMGAVEEIVRGFGEMAAFTSNGLVYDMLQNKGDYVNYKLGEDNKVIFHADHNNSGSGATLGGDELGAGRIAMLRQKDKANRPLNIKPKYLIVAPEREFEARKLIASETDPTATASGVVNVHKNSMEIIVDSELDAAPWYMASNRRTIKVGYLAGRGRKPIIVQNSQSATAVEYECVYEFGLVAQDFRTLYKNTGV